MRSVVGLLPIALGLLMAVGCALPGRDSIDTDKYSFRSRRALKTNSDFDSSSSDRLSFGSPQRKSRQNQGVDESERADSNRQFVEADTRSKKSGHDSSEIASQATDADNAVSNRATHSRKRNPNAPSANSIRSQIKSVNAELHGDDSETPVIKPLVELRGLEFDGMESLDPAKGSLPFEAGSNGNERNANSAAENQQNPQDVEKIPSWSDRPNVPHGVGTPNANVSANSADNQVSLTNAIEIAPNAKTNKFSPIANPSPWQAELNQLIARVEQRLAQLKLSTRDDGDVDAQRWQTELRLLYLLAQRQEEALTAIPGLTSSEQEYWQQILWAMFNSLDTTEFPDQADRAAHTVVPLSAALRHIREEAPLTIKNMAFCKKISGFGNYERFPRNEFPPGYEVLLYTEIENFVSSPTGDGEFRTSLRSTIEIANSIGKRVWLKRFSTPTEDFCRNPRRDYFQNCHFHIPEDLPTGEYSLKLTIADEISQKKTSSTLKFVLK